MIIVIVMLDDGNDYVCFFFLFQNFETPLHFACKFGHVDVAKYLVSHPLTNSSPRNKYGETPEQVLYLV